MSKIIEAIREGNRARRMRLGQNAADFVTLRSNPEVRMAMVPLIEREHELAWEAAASLDVPENVYGTEVRDRWLRVNMLYYALREPSDANVQVFETPEELAASLDDSDINHLSEEYQGMSDYSSPSLDGISDEGLDELKKALETIEWSALSGKAWWHLKAFFMTLTVEQLKDNSHSRSSILSLIGMSDESGFTPGAYRS